MASSSRVFTWNVTDFCRRESLSNLFECYGLMWHAMIAGGIGMYRGVELRCFDNCSPYTYGLFAVDPKDGAICWLKVQQVDDCGRQRVIRYLASATEKWDKLNRGPRIIQIRIWPGYDWDLEEVGGRLSEDPLQDPMSKYEPLIKRRDLTEVVITSFLSVRNLKVVASDLEIKESYNYVRGRISCKVNTTPYINCYLKQPHFCHPMRCLAHPTLETPTLTRAFFRMERNRKDRNEETNELTDEARNKNEGASADRKMTDEARYKNERTCTSIDETRNKNEGASTSTDEARNKNEGASASTDEAKKQNEDDVQNVPEHGSSSNTRVDNEGSLEKVESEPLEPYHAPKHSSISDDEQDTAGSSSFGWFLPVFFNIFASFIVLSAVLIALLSSMNIVPPRLESASVSIMLSLSLLAQWFVFPPSATSRNAPTLSHQEELSGIEPEELSGIEPVEVPLN